MYDLDLIFKIQQRLHEIDFYDEELFDLIDKLEMVLLKHDLGMY